MEEDKQGFIEFLFANGLKVFDNPADDKTLKSKRISPWFLNIGDFNDGVTLAALTEAYADTIIASGVKVDLLYGIPDKGVALSPSVAAAMARKGYNVGWFFTRKMPKDHGEATAVAKTDLTKVIVGRIPKEGQSIGQLDDVFTAGDTKYNARKELQGFGNYDLPLLAIALDRQEVDITGKSAIAEYESKTGTKVVSAVRATDVIDYLKEEFMRGGENKEDSIIISRFMELKQQETIFLNLNKQ